MIHDAVLIELLCIIMLCIPLIWELKDDDKGDTTHRRDVFWRGAIMFAVSLMVWGISHHSGLKHGFSDSFYMSFSIFFLMFDYAIAAVLGHDDWFTYLGHESKIDQISWWRNMNPWLRFIIKMANFSVALIVYF